jgi:hypothetical protein
VRHLLALLHFLFISTLAYSQDCNKLVVTVTDKVSGKSVISTPTDIIVSDDDEKTGFAIQISLLGNDRTIAWIITAKGAGHCINEGDEIRIFFTDESCSVLKNMTKLNCDQRATVFFGGGYTQYHKELELLKSKKIASLIVTTKDGLVQNDFTEDEASTLMNTFVCISRRIKR